MGNLKKAWKSVTIWFNGVALAALPFADNAATAIKETLPVVSQYLTSGLLKYAAIFILVANIALRFKTNSALKDK